MKKLSAFLFSLFLFSTLWVKSDTALSACERTGVDCSANTEVPLTDSGKVILGDEQTDKYFPLLKGRRIAIFSNHTGMVGDKHLLDVLVENGFNVTAIFSPEHGFRGNADAGEHVSSSTDENGSTHLFAIRRER
ncbi:YzbB [Bacteroides pyogenes JCM 6292]|uniref:YzbB n=2 Tax=Bacteroides pyogenes TaxID=310300 RepID=W4PDZ1_9BACE|nr:YzbB [Bacteroides pyogenes JCM 6292]GAE17982.1 YzbB [Bacteroides pyogenes DSM 20611 = JCM 6294]